MSARRDHDHVAVLERKASESFSHTSSRDGIGDRVAYVSLPAVWPVVRDLTTALGPVIPETGTTKRQTAYRAKRRRTSWSASAVTVGRAIKVIAASLRACPSLAPADRKRLGQVRRAHRLGRPSERIRFR